MNNSTTTTELQDAAEHASHGLRDREEMRKACEEMDRVRIDVKRRLGSVEVAVELIREAREE